MKIKVRDSGTTEFGADGELEAAVRAALNDGEVASVIMDRTDMERETDDFEHVTVTEDDGTVLWSGWLCGEPPAGTDDSPAFEAVRDQAHRYLTAIHGKDYVYAAPETFSNVLERWIWAVAGSAPELAEKCIADIEQWAASRDGGSGD